ncbi:MAG: AMP-binding protein [Hyphomicrobiaceae bacterium]|nr:AMP-binding protein [Hyphomicrobiaceae bacterium]
MLQGARNASALCDDASDGALTYGDLDDLVSRVSDVASAAIAKPLVMVLADNTIGSAASLLGAWRSGAAVALANPDLDPARTARLIAAYAPDFVVTRSKQAVVTELGYVTASPPIAGMTALTRSQPAEGRLHADLALLLFTSGSTGEPKAVRLSRTAVAHNTAAIAASLSLDPSHRALGHLKLHYSYGMSVLLSALCAGGSVVLTEHSVANPAFWAQARARAATSFPGVPAHYALLRQIKFDVARFAPSLRQMTQAGGKCAPDVLAPFVDMMRAAGGSLHVMYGQTEAGPRMASHAVSAPGADPAAAGRALRDGSFSIVDESGNPLPAGEPGVVVYRGPNVMMGYAERRADLSAGDECAGVLHTGDIGRLSADGVLTIVGRNKRFAKAGGVRCNLDLLEACANELGHPAAIIPLDDRIAVVFAGIDAAEARRLALSLARKSGLAPGAVVPRSVADLPLLPSGKIDYASLAASIGGS